MKLTKQQLKEIIIKELEDMMNGEEQEQDPAEAKKIVDQFLTAEVGMDYWKQGFEFLSQLGFIPPLERGTYIEPTEKGYLKDRAAHKHTPALGLEIHYWSDEESISQLKKFLESVGIRNYGLARYGNNPFAGDLSGSDKNFDPSTTTGIWYRNSGRDGIILFDAQDHV